MIPQKKRFKKKLSPPAIFKAYVEGQSVKRILRDYDIKMNQFRSIMYSMGGEAYNPSLFNFSTMSYDRSVSDENA